MLRLAPLGNIVERKRLVLVKSVLLILALHAAAFAPGLWVLMGASLMLALLDSLGQDFIPMTGSIDKQIAAPLPENQCQKYQPRVIFRRRLFSFGVKPIVSIAIRVNPFVERLALQQGLITVDPSA